MEQAVIVGASQPLRLVTTAIPEPSESGFLLKTLYAGVCHSDLHVIKDECDVGDGTIFRVRDILGERFAGMVLGHEICGVITKFGSDVPDEVDVKINDVVIVYPWRGCTKCRACLIGRTPICDNNQAGTVQIGLGPDWSGGYSTYVNVPEWQLAVKLPANIPPDVGSMLPCSGLTVYSALVKTRQQLALAARLRGVANLLVIGLGGLGQWAVTLAKSLFSEINVRVIAVDSKKEALDRALKLGADDVILTSAGISATELADHVTLKKKNRMDAVVDLVGAPQTFKLAYATLSRGGQVVVVGLHGGDVAVPLSTTVQGGYTIQGNCVGTFEELTELVRLLSERNVNRFPEIELVKLQDINQVLDRLREGKVPGRAIIQHV